MGLLSGHICRAETEGSWPLSHDSKTGISLNYLERTIKNTRSKNVTMAIGGKVEHCVLQFFQRSLKPNSLDQKLCMFCSLIVLFIVAFNCYYSLCIVLCPVPPAERETFFVLWLVPWLLEVPGLPWSVCHYYSPFLCFRVSINYVFSTPFKNGSCWESCAPCVCPTT